MLILNEDITIINKADHLMLNEDRTLLNIKSQSFECWMKKILNCANVDTNNECLTDE